MSLILDIEHTVAGIKRYIKCNILNNAGFGYRHFYGATFSLALFHSDKKESELNDLLLAEYDNLDKADTEFHWEFNNYALTYIYNSSETYDELKVEVSKRLFPLKFKYTPCTNWTLLRSVVKVMNLDISGEQEAIKKTRKVQLKSGLILDDPGVKSFQYHCFSAAMLYELYMHTNNIFFKKSFLRAVDFISNFILVSGETLYIGRGQHQSFGYGALVYILSQAYSVTADPKYYSFACDVFKYIHKFQRDDGAFPLVLNGCESTSVVDYTYNNKGTLGWYPYNNFFDYLPFMAFFLFKSIQALKKTNFNPAHTDFLRDHYQDNSFKKVHSRYYEAIVALPGGYWTNDLSLPYVVVGGAALTPTVGGEQFQESLYSEQDLGLPVFPCFGKSFRKWGRFLLFGSLLFGISPFGILIRKYNFSEREIGVFTITLSPFSVENRYFLPVSGRFKKKQNKFVSDRGIVVFPENSYFDKEHAYSASGELLRIVHRSKVSNIKLEVKIQ